MHEKLASLPANESVTPAEPLDQYRRLIEGLRNYAIFTLTLDGRFATWNSGAMQTFYFTEREVLGKHYSLIFTTEDIAKGRPQNELQSAIEQGRESVEGWHVRKDGTRFWCTDTVQTIRDARGTVTGFSKIVRDSTERHEAAENLRRSEELLRLMIEGVTDYAIYCIDPGGKIIQWNRGAENVFGYPAAEVLGKHFSLTYTPDSIARGVPDGELATAAAEGYAVDEAWHVRRGGTLFFSAGRMTRLQPDSDGRPRGFVKISHDVTERNEADERIKRKAFHDDLTRLPNRAMFVESLQRALEIVQRDSARRFALLYIDLDRFKVINDSLGHVLADDLLVHVARTLERCVRPGDVVARLGGDEFVVLVPDVQGPADAIHIANRAQSALQDPIYLDGFEVLITASIGIAVCNSRYGSPDDVLRDADTAMYEAKALGRARYVLFGPELHARAIGLLKLQMDLRRAILRREFLIEYQPIVSLADCRVVGFEALVRWNHPELGLLPPTAFLAEAENMGVIIQIDRWVLQEACRQLRAWQTKYDDVNLTVSVNLSSKQFAHEHLLKEIKGALRTNNLTARSLKLEITETVMMEHVEATAQTIAEVGDLGVELYIDDFGTGYSSLSYLTRLPLKVLKVDRSFVGDISLNPRSAVIARTVISLAHSLGLVALAEGIETEHQLGKLQELGCELGQGFWFSKPLAPEVAEHLIGCVLPPIAGDSPAA